jgi:hypothetical protein
VSDLVKATPLPAYLSLPVEVICIIIVRYLVAIAMLVQYLLAR